MTRVAVDTNVLSELLLGGPQAAAAASVLNSIAAVSPLVVSPTAYTELLVVVDTAELDASLGDMNIACDLEPDRTVWIVASRAWRDYLRRRRRSAADACPGCGKLHPALRCPDCGAALGAPRHILSDFLIGAHAQVRASKLITWDRGVYPTYFPNLEIVHPN